jgi:hypothetical protein
MNKKGNELPVTIPTDNYIQISKEDFSKLTYRQKFSVTEYGYLLSPEDAEVVGKMLESIVKENDILLFCQSRGKKVLQLENIRSLLREQTDLSVKNTALFTSILWFVFSFLSNMYVLNLFDNPYASEIQAIAIMATIQLLGYAVVFLTYRYNKRWIGKGIIVASLPYLIGFLVRGGCAPVGFPFPLSILLPC